jgi:hypothetical protein
VFTGGERFALEKGSSAILTPNGLSSIQGVYHRLDPVPMIPSMSDISLQEVRGIPGGIIVRGDSAPISWISDLKPPDGGTALANEVILSFSARTQKGPFKLAVIDASGTTVYSRDGVSEAIKIGPGVLKPGMLYTWKISTTKDSPNNSNEATFTTVPEEYVVIRNRLLTEFNQRMDPDLKSMLEAMDRWLGLTD